MKLNIAIVDDDLKFRRNIATSAQKWAERSNINVVTSEYSSAESFLFAYEDKKDYDLLLLDIEMKYINGIEMAKLIRREDETVQIVFITGYPDYMCYGYDVSALHYLIKPLSDEKLFQVLDRALKNVRKNSKRVMFSTTDGEKAVLLESILYAESHSHNMHVITTEGSFDIRATVSSLLKMLGDSFISTHRSYIVNLSHVVLISKNDVILDTGKKIPVSRNEFEKVHSAFVKHNKGELV